jgi:hypothetical protein
MAGNLRTQNFQILSTPLSYEYKIAEQKCNQICSTVKYVEVTKIVILPKFIGNNEVHLKVNQVSTYCYHKHLNER